jgi:hypothetical protein
MKFLNYINEDEAQDRYNAMSLEHIHHILETNCKPALTFMHKTKCGFRRFTKNFNPMIDKFKLIIPRTDRRALDTPQELSDMVDEIFFKQFGWRPRKEAVFAWTANIDRQSNILDTGSGIIFPTGEFKVIFSQGKITDFFIWADSRWREFIKSDTGPIIGKHFHTLPEQDRKDFVNFITPKIKEAYTDDIKKLKKSESGEIMIKCNSYYITSNVTARELNVKGYI